MANLVATPGWDDVYEIKTSDWIMAGETGVANSQAQALLNKTEHLRQLVENAMTVATTIVNPIGTIKLWYGSPASIPTGWQLCNGTNGTPNLHNKFVVGAGGTYTLGQNVGSHTFSATTTDVSFSGSHTHGVSSSYGGSHSHYVTISSSSSSCTGPFKPKSSGGYPINCTHDHTPLWISGGSHSHASNPSSQEGIHKHNVTITNCSLLPSYFLIYHIMRVS